MSPVRPCYAERSLSAAFYDTVAGADPHIGGDAAIYARLVPQGASILELGTGTGRLAFALAERGFAVTGVDIAPAMLAQASAKRSELDPQLAARVELKRGDMTALDLQRTFDLVVAPSFALAHLPRGGAWRNTFATAARHLKTGGVAAFHLPLIEFMRRPPPTDQSRPIFDHPTPSGGRLVLFVRERSFREAVGRFDQVIEYVEVDARGSVLRRSPERLTYYIADPVPFAAAEGLTPDPTRIAFDEVGEIWVFRKTGG